jgi:pSer/pThr/pTyr-binding forkhead associated (FHA) protein
MDSVIEDAGSKNGTRVNGELVQRHVLKHGDLLRVGSVSFRYVDTATGADSD